MIAVLGQANAGKSTLVNALAGEKVSIVSAKPHTTRYDVYGIVCHDDTQFIFIDTPGLIQRPQGPLQHYLTKMTSRGLRDADAIIVVVDAKAPIPESTITLLEKSQGKPLLIVLNKVDSVAKDILLPLAQRMQTWSPWIAMTSGKTGSGIPFILESMAEHMPTGPWLFDADDMTQISQRMWAAEMTREKIYQCVHFEIPYHTHVITDEWTESAKSIVVYQTIYVDNDRYKKWIIGHKGQRIRLMGEQSRHDLSNTLGKEVHLYLKVKTDASWFERIRTQ